MIVPKDMYQDREVDQFQFVRDMAVSHAINMGYTPASTPNVDFYEISQAEYDMAKSMLDSEDAEPAFEVGDWRARAWLEVAENSPLPNDPGYSLWVRGLDTSSGT
jgi:hypothetical protein